jgi:ketosteroid isomerase-like protein
MIIEDDETLALAARFFDAIEAGDIARMVDCLHPDAPIWHNTDEREVTVEMTRVTLTGMLERIAGPRYADRRLAAFPGGFVQQHRLEGTRVHDGEPVHLPCCIVCQVGDGRITRIDEYFDSAHVAQFRKYA